MDFMNTLMNIRVFKRMNLYLTGLSTNKFSRKTLQYEANISWVTMQLRFCYPTEAADLSFAMGSVQCFKRLSPGRNTKWLGWGQRSVWNVCRSEKSIHEYYMQLVMDSAHRRPDCVVYFLHFICYWSVSWLFQTYWLSDSVDIYHYATESHRHSQ
jgi:hypothetical protein